MDSPKYGVFITRYVANILPLARRLISYLHPVTFIYGGDTGYLLFWACSGYSWRTFSHRKILLSHHPALLFLTVASFFASNNRICEFLAPIDSAGCDSYSAFLSFWQPPFHYSSTGPAHHDLWAPFHFQNNQSPHHISLKASWVLVYLGVESCFVTGVWAGRCVIAHLDDCWGPSRRSQASFHRRGTADIVFVAQVKW